MIIRCDSLVLEIVLYSIFNKFMQDYFQPCATLKQYESSSIFNQQFTVFLKVNVKFT